MSNTQNTEIIISFEDVKMKDFRAYWQAVATGDWQGQDAFFAKVVKAWPFEGEPSEIEAYGELSLLEYNQIQDAIKQSSKNIADSLKQKRTTVS